MVKKKWDILEQVCSSTSIIHNKQHNLPYMTFGSHFTPTLIYILSLAFALLIHNKQLHPFIINNFSIILLTSFTQDTKWTHNRSLERSLEWMSRRNTTGDDDNEDESRRSSFGNHKSWRSREKHQVRPQNVYKTQLVMSYSWKESWSGCHGGTRTGTMTMRTSPEDHP